MCIYVHSCSIQGLSYTHVVLSLSIFVQSFLQLLFTLPLSAIIFQNKSTFVTYYSVILNKNKILSEILKFIKNICLKKHSKGQVQRTVNPSIHIFIKEQTHKKGHFYLFFSSFFSL